MVLRWHKRDLGSNKDWLNRGLDMWIVPLLIAVGFGGIIVLLVLAEKDGF